MYMMVFSSPCRRLYVMRIVAAQPVVCSAAAVRPQPSSLRLQLSIPEDSRDRVEDDSKVQ
jgi:hypothetical protein